MMHQFQFHRYDPAQPMKMTSFKGKQKLIFEGYRYNIHHIVSSKGVKTWRCVHSKKLTGSRSWCKARAETWNDEDSQVVFKGEHNHPQEHEVAEKDFFRSQLILAAVSSLQANLNDLIDAAIAQMSEGVSFRSRESLKKSLTEVRKQAENEEFKLKCYENANMPFKNLTKNKIGQLPQLPLGNGEKEGKEVKEDDKLINCNEGKGVTGNVLPQLALAKVAIEAVGKNKEKPNQGPIVSGPQTHFSSIKANEEAEWAAKRKFEKTRGAKLEREIGPFSKIGKGLGLVVDGVKDLGISAVKAIQGKIVGLFK